MSAPVATPPRLAAGSIGEDNVAAPAPTSAIAAAKNVHQPDRSDGSEQPPAKRKRPQSCDTCRSRKIKCVRLQVEGLEPGADQRCVQCRAIEAKCTFDYVPKRPGPQSSFAKTAKREQQAQAQAQAQARVLAQSQARGKAADALPSTIHDKLPAPVPAELSFPNQAVPPFDENWYKAFAQSLHGSATSQPTFDGQVRPSAISGAAQDAFLMGRSIFDATSTPFNPFGTNFSGEVPNPTATLPFSPADVQVLDADRRYSQPSGFGNAGARIRAQGLPAAATSFAQAYAQHQPPHRPGEAHLFATPLASSSQIKSTPLQVPFPPDSLGQSPDSSVGTTSAFPHQLSAPGREGLGSSSTLQSHKAPAQCKSKGPSPSKVYARPVVRPRSLDDIAPRQTFMSILALYFHYLWPLMPIVDRPSFSYDLMARRDARDETFLAFVLSLTSYTLIQCPRTVIPAPWSLYRKLHRICHRTSRRMQPRRYEPPRLLHVATLYCDHIYLGTIGQVTASNAALGEAVRIAFALGIHDERRLDPYNARNVFGIGVGVGIGTDGSVPRRTVNAVERELRKRVFWLLHGSSTTIAVLQDEPMFIRDIDTCVDLPLAVDEVALSSSHLEQRGPSLLCGFVTVSRLHQLLSELLEMYRRDRRFPVHDLSTAKSRLAYISNILKRVRKALADMPEELRKPRFTHQPAPSMRPTGGAPSNDGWRSLPGAASALSVHSQTPLQAIGVARPPSPGIHGGGSDAPAWSWPADTFDKDGLPNTEALSTNSSANHSPRAQSALSVSTSGPASVAEGCAGLSASASAVLHWPGGGGPAATSTEQWGCSDDAFRQVHGGGSTDGGFVGPGVALDLGPRPELDTDPAALNAAMDEVNAFRPSPPPQPMRGREPILSPLCTLHANVIVTEAMVRFVIVEYRELIGARIVDLRARGQVDFGGRGETFGYNDARDGWEAAAKDMLDVLHGMPLEALTSNGQSMTSKIIYVVSSLLNRTSTNTRGFSYMTSFLQMLTKLTQDRGSNAEEQNATLSSSEDEGDAEPPTRSGSQLIRGSGGDAGLANTETRKSPAAGESALTAPSMMPRSHRAPGSSLSSSSPSSSSSPPSSFALTSTAVGPGAATSRVSTVPDGGGRDPRGGNSAVPQEPFALRCDSSYGGNNGDGGNHDRNRPENGPDHYAGTSSTTGGGGGGRSHHNADSGVGLENRHDGNHAGGCMRNMHGCGTAHYRPNDGGHHGNHTHAAADGRSDGLPPKPNETRCL
ncbi:hypothetical protein ACQY0O_003733 [Thecaphora frezii]